MKLSAEVLKQEFQRGGNLQKLLLLYTEMRLNQISQIAVCKSHHEIEKDCVVGYYQSMIVFKRISYY